ncbi:MAG TPA: hypothetical protein VN851_06285, partial [Thermoanaerobaculia bacterium]|nr:hypothetical protein [Thermoanaerobaculia bacterium]
SPSNVTAVKSATGTFEEGGTVTYSIVLTNNGSGPQADNPGNELTDVLPASLTLVSASATSGTTATVGNTVTWNGSIPAAGSVTVTITATINAGTNGTPIVNQASIASDSNGDGVNETNTTSNAFTIVVGGVPSVIDIPTLSGIGFTLLFLVLAGFGAFMLRRRRADA